MKRTILPFALALLACPLLGASPFEHEYSPASGHLPQETTAAWKARHGGGSVEIRDARLIAKMPGGERRFFAMGTLEESENPDRDAAWNGVGGTATVEFRVRCESDDPNLEIFQVQISTGHLQWRIRFFNDKLYPRAIPIEAREADTYRAVLKDGKLTLSSQRQGVLFANLPGNEAYAGKPTRSNALWFGSFSRNAKAPGSTGLWELEFIRWTHREALPDLSKTPEPKPDPNP